MIRGAMVGFGNVAVNGHLPAWKEAKKFEIVAVCDNYPKRKKVVGKHLPAARFYNQVEDLLDKEELDFVDICTPPGEHYPLLETVLKKGINVICEKPLVIKPEEMDRLKEKFTDKSPVVFTVHNWKCAPQVKKIKELIAGGKIGEIKRCRWNIYRSGPADTTGDGHKNWRINPRISGGGILMDHGWHAFYILMDWFDLPQLELSAQLKKLKYKNWEVEDTSIINLKMPEAEVEIFLTWTAEERQTFCIINGSKGNIILEEDKIFLQTEREKKIYGFAESLSQGSHHPDWFKEIVKDFYREVNDCDYSGKNFQEARNCFELIRLAKRSHCLQGKYLRANL